MNQNTELCQYLDQNLSTFLEGDLNPEDERLVNQHLLECSKCSAIHEDFTRLIAASKKLPEVAAPDMWQNIESQITDRAIQSPLRLSKRRSIRKWTQFSLAAVMLITLSSVVTRAFISSGSIASNNGETQLSQVEFLESLHTDQIDQLRIAAENKMGLLDSSTAAIVKKNLDIIDAAIAESRAALIQDSGSIFLYDQLDRAYERKADILRHISFL